MIIPDNAWFLNDPKFATLYAHGTAGSNFVDMILIETFNFMLDLSNTIYKCLFGGLLILHCASSA